MANRVLRLVSRPTGVVAETDLKLSQEEIPKAAEGQLVCKNLYISMDPTHRIWMSDKPQYMPPVQLGEVMRSTTIAVVTESKNAEWPVGTYACCFGGVCDYFIGIPGQNVVFKCETSPKLPLTVHLSVGSIIMGLAAWYGVKKVIQPKAGDYFVVSGGAGATGSMAGQLAKLAGAKVCGIAGSDAKCKWLTETLGFDHAINYKTQDVAAALKAWAPDGVHGYYDNVGGKVTDAVLLNCRNNATVGVCGSISEYNDSWEGQKNFNMILMRRLTVKGFICLDHLDMLADFQNEVHGLVSEGKLIYQEDIKTGIENYVSVINMLWTGDNAGKLMLKINDP